MGYMRHHAIVVSTWDEKCAEQAREKALEIFGRSISAVELETMEQLVSPLVRGMTNGYASFFVAPDGSKEGWNTSDAGNRNRDDFIAWMESEEAWYLDWVEVQFGDEDHSQRVTRASDLEEPCKT